MKGKRAILLGLFSFILIVASTSVMFAQHNNELYNNGAMLHISAGAEMHVLGDVHNIGSSATYSNDGLVIVQGNMYSDNLFEQRGTGTTRLINNLVNIGETQFISGSYAVRGVAGVDDGSFYNLELCNDLGIVWLNGTGNVTDVRNQIDFSGTGSPVVNRIITHDPNSLPLNGDAYSAVFGIMNSSSGLASMLDNTVTTNGNMSGIDNGFVQGKLRRQINSLGGSYDFVVGLEPGGLTAQRGVQFVRLDIDANDYGTITTYFMSGLDNTVPGINVECSGYYIDYFGGTDHGQWVFEDETGTGTGAYEVNVWPQDHNMPANTLWLITRDNLISGTADQCGPTTVGLSRDGFNDLAGPGGNSSFGVAGAEDFALPSELINIWTEAKGNYIQVNWIVGSENELSHYILERSTDGFDFDPIATLEASGNSTTKLHYSHNDQNVLREQDYYYRYKAVDFNGSEEYSPIVSGRLSENPENLSIDLYPNPAREEITLLLKTAYDRSIEILLYNNIGQLIAYQAQSLYQGSNGIPIQLENIVPGIYNFLIRDPETGKTLMKRFIKE